MPAKSLGTRSGPIFVSRTNHHEVTQLMDMKMIEIIESFRRNSWTFTRTCGQSRPARVSGGAALSHGLSERCQTGGRALGRVLSHRSAISRRNMTLDRMTLTIGDQNSTGWHEMEHEGPRASASDHRGVRRLAGDRSMDSWLANMSISLKNHPSLPPNEEAMESDSGLGFGVGKTH